MSEQQYPLPKNAVAVTLRADGRLQIYMPGVKPGVGHSVAIPPNQNGMRTLIHILQQRQRDDTPKSVSGQMSSPTQQIVDAWMKDNAPSKPVAVEAKPKKASSAILANLDISGLVDK